MKLLMPVFLLLAAPWLQGAESFEVSTTVDGIHRWSGLLLYSGKKISGALTFRLTENSDSIFMFGFNSPFFSAGHLGGTGLIAEVRRPEHDSSYRLVEKTRYRANLRSYSSSRIGVALMPLDARIGLAWERRRDVDAGIIWVVPFLTDSWSLEALGLFAMLRSAISDDSWYPRRLQRAASPLGIVSSRLRYSFLKSDVGITVITSGGTNLRVGYLVGLSINTSNGPWGFFFRGIYSTPYFHSAGGKRLEIPIGGRFGLQFKPGKGLQFSVGYKAGLERFFPKPWRFSDKGSLGLGWSFSELRIFLSSDWDYVFSKKYDGDVIRRIKLRIDWDRDFYNFGLSSAIEPVYGRWYVKLEGGVPITDSWKLGAFIKLREAAKSLLLDFRIKGTWNIENNQFIMMVHMRDLVRDWRHGPSTAGDLVLNLRWIRKLGKTNR